MANLQKVENAFSKYFRDVPAPYDKLNVDVYRQFVKLREFGELKSVKPATLLVSSRFVMNPARFLQEHSIGDFLGEHAGLETYIRSSMRSVVLAVMPLDDVQIVRWSEDGGEAARCGSLFLDVRHDFAMEKVQPSLHSRIKDRRPQRLTFEQLRGLIETHC